MAGAASARQAATATHGDTSQEKAGRRRRSSANRQGSQQGATATAATATAALDSLSRLQQLADASPRVAQLRRLQALADGHYTPVAQLAGAPEEEELIQGKFATAELPPQLQQPPRANNTGLPDQLKSGIESLSGLSMDHVRVHFNSAQPAQLNALAYAQGSDIHLAPGQERHLPHEAWHVVQQAQGRVKPTMQMKDGVQVNDDAGLEREADVMGSKALEGGHRAVETHRCFSMPIDTAQRIEGDALNSPEAIVANNHSAPLANGQGSAERGGNEMQNIAHQCAQAALQRQVQAWGDGSDRVEELRVWQRVADGRGVGGKSQDLTPGFAAQRQAQEGGGHLFTQLASSPRQLAQRRLTGQMLGSAVQRVEGELDEEEGGAAQLRSEPVQRVEVGLDEEEEPAAAAQLRAEPAQLEENRTGMPDGLKAGIESLSGMDMSDVRVHHNSSAPAQLNALAFAQGNDIHLGPGQEQHLPHEAWHVVQQRQGRVQATMQMAGVGVNDDVGLEREADVMGGRAQGGAVKFVAGGGQLANRAVATAETHAVQTAPARELRVVQRLTKMIYNSPSLRQNTDVINGMSHTREAHNNTNRLIAKSLSGYNGFTQAPGNCNHYVPYASVKDAVRKAISTPQRANLGVAVAWLTSLVLPGADTINITPLNQNTYGVQVGQIPHVDIQPTPASPNHYDEENINREVDDLIYNLANDPRNLFYWPSSSGDGAGTLLDTPYGGGPMNVNVVISRLQNYRQSLITLGFGVV